MEGSINIWAEHGRICVGTVTPGGPAVLRMDDEAADRLALAITQARAKAARQRAETATPPLPISGTDRGTPP